MSIATTTTAAGALQQRLPGIVHLPGSPAYERLATAWDLAVTQTPVAIAEPGSAAEVAGVVHEAARLGLRVAPQTTGHSAAPLSQQGYDDVVLLRTTRLRDVHVDPARRVARIGGGAVWADVIAPAAAHGLAVLHGSAADVGVVGYTLGGGLSFYSRQYGVAANSVTAIELVRPAGHVVRVDPGTDPELFWALRGGVPANFGVVTAVEMSLIPVAEVYAGMMIWDIQRAEQVLSTWASWATHAPDDATTSFRIMRFPENPGLPPFLSGRRLVVVDGAVLGSERDAAELLTPLRNLGPEMDTFARIPVTALTDVHMDPPGPTPSVAQGAILEALDEEGIRTLLDEVGPSADSPLMFVELRQLGGAIGRPAAGGGAISSLPGAYAMFACAIAPTRQAAETGHAAARAIRRAMVPWTNARTFPNFNHGESPVSTGYDADTFARLRAVRARVDPNRVFVPQHAIY
jgi:FAD/FMN-containing dehydrogenase